MSAGFDESLDREQPLANSETVSLLVGVVLVALLFWLPAITGDHLRHWDEAWYAQASRETMSHGNGLTVYWNGAPWFHKPPLAFWLTGACFHLFGVSEWAARLVSLLSGLACVALVAWKTSIQWGRVPGWCAGLSLVAIPDFSRYAVRGQLDVPVTLTIVVALIAWRQGTTHDKWDWIAGAALGLGMMVKGSAVFLALVVLIADAAVNRDWGFLKRRSFWAGIGIALMIAAPWHFHQMVEHGHFFVNAYFRRHIVQFFNHIYEETAPSPSRPFYYVAYLVKRQSCFTLATLAASVYSLWNLRSLPRSLRHAMTWAIAILLALSFSQQKAAWYLVPIYPALALVAGELVGRLTIHRKDRLAIALGVTAFITVFSQRINDRPREHEPEIAALAESVDRWVAPGSPIQVYQGEHRSTAIYPIAAAFYTGRPVHVCHSFDGLVSLSIESKSVFHLLVHEREADRFIAESTTRQSARVEDVARAGVVRLLRVVPPAIAATLPMAN